MAKGVFEGMVTGTRDWADKKTGEFREHTFISLGPGSEVHVPGHGYAIGQTVFVVGDLRFGQNGPYFSEGESRVYRREPTICLYDLLPLIGGQTK